MPALLIELHISYFSFKEIKIHIFVSNSYLANIINQVN